MKTIMMILAVLLSFLTLILLGSCGAGKYVPKANEEIYGTWINEKYGTIDSTTPTYSPQKEIIDASGYTAYLLISGNPTEKGPETIVSKWTDSEGNIWYKTFGTASVSNPRVEGGVLRLQSLQKLSKSATVRECMFFWHSKSVPDNYPTRIDITSDQYRVFYRAKE